MKSTALKAAILALALTALPAMAAEHMVSANNPASILNGLKGLGYAGSLDKLKSGRTAINVQISGVQTNVLFYGCADDMTNCQTLLFSVALDLKDGTTLDMANQWNFNQISGRVSLDKEMDPTLDLPLTTGDGIPLSAFEANVKLWDGVIGDFKDFFKF